MFHHHRNHQCKGLPSPPSQHINQFVNKNLLVFNPSPTLLNNHISPLGRELLCFSLLKSNVMIIISRNHSKEFIHTNNKTSCTSHLCIHIIKIWETIIMFYISNHYIKDFQIHVLASQESCQSGNNLFISLFTMDQPTHHMYPLTFYIVVFLLNRYSGKQGCFLLNEEGIGKDGRSNSPFIVLGKSSNSSLDYNKWFNIASMAMPILCVSPS